MNANNAFAKMIYGLALALICTLPATQAQSRGTFDTGFEKGQGYNLGALNGQDGWQAEPNYVTIENSLVEAGKQALQIGSPPSGSYFEFANAPLQFPITNQHTTVHVKFLSNNPHSAVQMGISIVGDTGFLGGIFEGGGSYFLGNYNSDVALGSFSNGQWHTLTLDFDFIANTVTGHVDTAAPQTIALNPPNGTPTSVKEVQLYSITGATNLPSNGFYDQLEITYNSGINIPYFVK